MLLKMKIQAALLVAPLALLVGCGGTSMTMIEPGSTGSELYQGIDRYTMLISTNSRECQQWFDQGMQLSYGFNHEEAIRSFQEAAAADPDSPMPWWGIAYANGMNINDAEMTKDRYRAAYNAMVQANLRIDNADMKEAAMIRAMDARYSWPAPKQQRTLDEAYSREMGALHRAFSEDNDIAVMYAESMMNLQPWDYWTNSGDPKGNINEVVDVLEGVLADEPDHPGAAHFYIHAVEASNDPARALPAARMLDDRIPGSGHLVHMPSHIYIRVGKYAEASNSNMRAVQADRDFFDDAPEQGLYWLYFAHNLHFLAYASMMESRYDTAMLAARDLLTDVPEDFMKEAAPLVEGILATDMHVMVRFGKWEDILAMSEPPKWRRVSRAVRHYARGIAYAATDRTEEARAEQEMFEKAAAEIPEDWRIFNNTMENILPIARAMLEGEIAFREGNFDSAWASFDRGVTAEDALVYDEPPGWMLPVRHAYGALLMASGEFERAEAVYREDLRLNRDNGWSLLGLRLALEAQDKVDEAQTLESRIAEAWPRRDVIATSSCMCAPGEDH